MLKIATNISPSILMPVPVSESSSDMSYQDALSQTMEEMSRDPRVVFLGQGVRYPGTFMSTTLQGVPLDQRIETPVAEEMQIGMSIGLALAGFVPISI